jgi:dTDP-4-dehydrorhamnose reductase
LTSLLLELHERYRRPCAVTEVHLGCTREEQVRWLAEIWESASVARRAGVDVRAITAWCALGAYNWNSLVTRDEQYYEPGLFDVRGPAPRRTALAAMAQQLARGERPEHPVLGTPGWWRRPDRFLFAATHSDAVEAIAAVPSVYHGGAPEGRVLITGARGRLATALAHACRVRGLAHVALSHRELDVTDSAAVEEAVRRHRPWAVIHAAGSTYQAAVGRGVCAPGRLDAAGPAHVARACASGNARLLFFSSDQVFSPASAPYTETATPTPSTFYGRMQAEGERAAMQALSSALLVRTGPLFGFWEQGDFLTAILQALADGRQIHVPADILVSPSFVWDVVNAALDLLVDGEGGIWHLTSPEAISCADFAKAAAERAELDGTCIRPFPRGALAQRPDRLRFSPLGSVRQTFFSPVSAALDRAFEDLRRNHPRSLPCPTRGEDTASRVA